MRYIFRSGKELIRLCEEEALTIAEVMQRNEAEQGECPVVEVRTRMGRYLDIMAESVRSGLQDDHAQWMKIAGEDAKALWMRAPESWLGEELAQTAAMSMAVVEVNASMGRIVAAPTAGASGIIPAVLNMAAKRRNLSRDRQIDGLFTAGAVGIIIAEHAGIAGASGGCQAETGTAAAMAAAALAELSGADPETSLNAAAIAIANCLGLVCDPVAGLVECPCIKRNAIGTLNAVLACDMALSGMSILNPFDEAVAAMAEVGRKMDPDLKETARGGLAATPTAKKIAADLTAKGRFPASDDEEE